MVPRGAAADSRDGVGHAFGHQLGALHRVYCDIQIGRFAIADHLPIEQHRGLVFFTLTNHNRPRHLNFVQ
jgi:hypothetical protein